MRKIRKLLVLLMSVALLACVSALAIGCDCNQGFNVQKDNEITSLSLDGWTFGEDPNAPSVICTYGNAVFTYSTSEDGEFTSTVPTNAGVYYVKATVQATAQYKGAEKVVSFTIGKASNGITDFDTIADIHCHETPTLNARAYFFGGVTYTYSTVRDGEYGEAPAVFTAGIYYVKATSESNENYESASAIRAFEVFHNEQEVASPEYLNFEADCSHYAVYFKSCSSCGQKIVTETFEYEEGGYGEHKNVSHVEEVPATCQSVGYTEGEYCADCEEYISGHEVINKTSHEWVIDTENCKEPTCTEKGVIAYKCSNDGCTETYTEEGAEATGHLVTSWTKTGESKVIGTDRCEYQITYTGICEHCSAPQTRTETVEKHNFYYAITTEPTCQHDGVKTEYCLDEDCIYHTQEHSTSAYPLPAGSDGHDWQATSTANVYQCSHCQETKTVVSSNNDRIENVSVEELDGVDEIQLSTASVSLDDGVKDQLSGTFTISAKEVTDKSSVNIVGLSEEEKAQFNNSKAVYDFTLTSNEQGISQFGDDNYITIKIPYVLQAGDNPDKIIVWCVTEDGTAEAFDASYANGYVTFKTNHFSIYTIVEMTAEEYCKVNNCHSDEYISANLDKFLVVDPTCTIGGYTVCLNCGEIIKNTPATGHSWHSHTVTAVTCTENGQVHHECSVCGIGYETYVPATEHYYVISEQISATCTERGRVTYECTHCHDSYTVYTAKTDHRYVIETVEATCTSDGYTKKTCHLCGSETVTNYVPALDHVYGSEWVKTADGHYHVCERCGEIDQIIDHVPGAEATETTAQICTDCGYIITAPIGHICKQHLIEVDAKEADCLNGGNVKYYVCECGKWYLDEDAEQLIVDHLSVYTDALGHDIIQSPAVEPTCEDVGYTAGMWCTRCNKWVKGHVEIPATGHTYTATVIKATCENGGKTVYTCTACGHSYEGNYTNALGHKYNATVHAPTCTEGGYTEHVCSICGDRYTDAETSALGHKISSVWNKSETEHWHACGRCGEKFGVAEHTPDYAEATDTHGIKCTVCGYQIADRLDHVHSGVKHEGKEPTCTEGGSKEYYVCSCGDWFYDEACEKKVENKADLMIQPNGHATELHKGVPATCVSEGRTDGYYCTVCEKWISGNKVIPINPNNHAHVQHSEEIPATCTTEGVIEYWTCTDCNKIFSDKACTVEITDKAQLVIPVIAHDYEIKVVEPTCTEKGFTVHTCNVCGDTFESDEIEALGHAFGKEWKADKDGHFHVCEVCGELSEKEAHVPDYEQATEEHGITCTVCGYEIEGQLAHTHVGVKHEEVPSTCTENGSIEYYECACGKLFYDEECTKQIIDEKELIIPAHGHEYESKVVDPTCDKQGYTLHTCSLCGDTYKDEYTDATGHSYKDKVVKPTCTEGGFTLHVCEICNDTYVDEETEALKHNFKETWESNEKGHYHVCARCGIPSEIEEHVPDYDEATTEHGITCTVCGYEIAPKQEQQEDKPIYSYTTTVDMGETVIVFKAEFYKENNAAVMSRTINGRTETENSTWSLINGKILVEVDDMYLTFTVYEDKTIEPFVQDAEIVYTVEIDGNECALYEGGIYGYNIGGIQFTNDWYEEDGIVYVLYHGDGYMFTVMTDGTLVPYEKPQEKEVKFRYVTSYSDGPMGNTVVTYIFYNDNTYEATTVSGGEQVYHEESNWQVDDGKITLYADGMYYSFVFVGETAIRPYVKQEEVLYTANLYNYLDCSFYSDGVWAFMMGDIQFYNDYDETDGKISITFSGETFTFVVDKDGRTLVPYEEQQEKEVVYTYSDVFTELGNMEITVNLMSDFTLTGEFKVNGGSQNFEGYWTSEHNFETQTDYVICNVFGLKFAFDAVNGELVPSIYQPEDESLIKYRTTYNGVEIRFFVNGEYDFTTGTCQFYSDYKLDGDIIEIVFIGENVKFKVNTDGTLVPYGQGEDPQGKVELYRYEGSYAGPTGEVTNTFIFYNDNKYEVNTISGGEVMYHEEGDYNIVDGKITLYAETEGMYYSFVFNGDTIIPYIKDGEVKYTTLLYNYLDCSFYADGVWTFNMSGVQFFNNYTERDGKVIIVFIGQTVILTVDKDGVTLIPYEEQQGDKEVLYSFSDRIEMGGYVITYDYTFYTDNTYYFISVYGGEDEDEISGNWKAVDNKITINTEGMYVSFAIENDKISPYIKNDSSIKYTGQIYGGTYDCNFYEDGVYTFMIGKTQFFNNWYEQGDKVIVYLAQGPQTYVVNADGITISPYQGGGQPEEPAKVLYMYDEDVTIDGKIVGYGTYKIFDNGTAKVNISTREFGWNAETHWRLDNYDGVEVYVLDFGRLAVDFTVDGDDKLVPYVYNYENPLYLGYYNGVEIQFSEFTYEYTYGTCQFYGRYNRIAEDKIQIEYFGNVVTFIINADGSLSVQGGEQTEVKFDYKDMIEEDGKVVAEAEYVLYTNKTVILTVRGKTNRQLEGNWELKIDDDNVEYILCTFGDLSVIFDIDGDSLIPWINDDIDIVYTANYNGTEIRFAEDEYDFMFGSCQFYGDYTIYEEKYIDVELVGESVTFEIKDGRTLILVEEEPEEKEISYRYYAKNEYNGQELSLEFLLYTDNSSCCIEGNDLEHAVYGNWEIDIDDTIVVEVDGMYVRFGLFEGELTPIIKDGEIVYVTDIYGQVLSFYGDGIYVLDVGGVLQFYQSWYEENGKIIIIYGGQEMAFTVGEDGRTLVPYDETQDREILYTYHDQVMIDDMGIADFEYSFYDNGTFECVATLHAEEEQVDKISGKWQAVDGTITVDIEGMFVTFNIKGNSIVPCYKYAEVVYTGTVAGSDSNFYADGTYSFVLGNCQFFNYWQEKDGVAYVNYGAKTYSAEITDGTITIVTGGSESGQEPHTPDDQHDYVFKDQVGDVFLTYFLYSDNKAELFISYSNGMTKRLEGHWGLCDDLTLYCEISRYKTGFIVVDGQIVPYIYTPKDPSEIIYVVNYNGSEIRIFEEYIETNYDFMFGSVQFYGRYERYDDVIKIVLIDGEVSFRITEDGLVPIEEHGEDPQGKELVYNYMDSYSTADGEATASYYYYSDSSLEVWIGNAKGRNLFKGTWRKWADPSGMYAVGSFDGMGVTLEIKDGAVIPYIDPTYKPEAMYYRATYNGYVIQFYWDIYYYMVGNCQWNGSYQVVDGKIDIVTIDGALTFEIGEDGKTLTLVNEPSGEDPQGKEPLYTFVTAQSGGSQTVIITYNFYEENNQLLLVADVGGAQSTLPGTWHYDVEGRVVAEADYGMGGVFTVNPDGKTLTPYVEEIEADLVYTSSFQGMAMSFYANGVLQMDMGGQIMNGTWSVVKEGVVCIDVGGEVLYLTINEDGETLTPVMDETTIFVYRVAVINDKGEYIVTADIEFDYNDKEAYPYDSRTEIILAQGGMINIEKSLDGVNYIEANRCGYQSAGSYEVVYKKDLGGGSSYSINNMKNYDLPMVGTVEYEDGEYYAKGKNGNKVALTYTENDGIYHFDLSEIEEQYGHGFYDMYYVLEGRKFKIFIPETEANYTLNRDHYSIKLYDGGYLVFSEGNSKYCIAYSFMEDGEGNIYLVANGERILNVLGEIPYVIKNGILVDGWQEGDIILKVIVVGFSNTGKDTFLVGEGSINDLKFRVTYSDGSEEYVYGDQVEIKGAIDFNVAGKYSLIAVYHIDEENSYGTGFAIYVGNPNDVKLRYIMKSNVTWIINERGLAQPDLTGVYLEEYTFSGNSTRKQLTVRDLNSEDYNKAVRGENKSIYTIRTIYTDVYNASSYLEIEVATMTKAGIIECYENTEIRGDLFYCIDLGDFVTAPGMYCAVMEINYGIEIQKENGYDYRRFTLNVPFTMDLFNLDGNDFTANAGVYENVQVGNGLTDFVGNVKVTSFRTEDVQPTVIFGNIKTGQYVSLPDAYVGEDVEEYADRVYNFFSSDEIVIMYVHMANNVGLDSQMLNTIDRNQLDLRSFDSSNRGVTKVVINFENFLGIQEAIEINVNVVAR